MSGKSNNPVSNVASFLRQRIESPMRLWEINDLPPLGELLADAGLVISVDKLQEIDKLFTESISGYETRGLPLDDEHVLVIANIPLADLHGVRMMTIVQGSPGLACTAVRNAVEAWSLSGDVASSQAALEESAMQLAQSFEEQNWLRGFARNASSFTKCASANDVACGILQPLGYLLRAHDVFLLVHPEESERSGLVSAKFGESAFSVQTISELLESFGMRSDSQPLVRNHISTDTSDGVIHSVVAVAMSNQEQSLGFLVAINRSTDIHPSGLPVYDPEFGSGDVGLLEEAAVLLTTQAQNMHLLVQSNQLFLGTLHSMSSAIDARDRYTQGHSERVARLSYELAQILGLTDVACQEIYLAGILHDIGKIGVPDSVLLKPGSLTDEEFAIIKQHPEIGHRIVERLGSLQFVLPGILYHHERWDGRGYPHGLAGQAIPLMARVMAVADAFDAMTSSRPYRNAMPLEKANSIITSGAGEQWDAEVVACFSQWLNEHRPNQQSDASGTSIIPMDSPMEYMAQAVMTLVN